jgi:hypothetical protein
LDGGKVELSEPEGFGAPLSKMTAERIAPAA